MPQNYNVDDILEEIRRKKRQEGTTSTGTYAEHTGATRQPRQSGAVRPGGEEPGRRERPAASSARAGGQGTAQRERRPAAGGQDSVRRRASYEFGEQEQPRYAREEARRARPREELPRRTRAQEEPRSRYEEPPRPVRAARSEPEQPAYQPEEPSRRRTARAAEQGARPVGTPAYEPEPPRPSGRFEMQEERSVQRPARQREEPPYQSEEPAPKRRRFEIIDERGGPQQERPQEQAPYQPEQAAPKRRRFEIIDETGGQMRQPSGRTQFDFDSAPVENLREQPRRTVPPAQQEVLPPEVDEGGQSGYVDPMNIPLPDGSRNAAPARYQGKGFTMSDGFTQEVEPPPRSRRRRARTEDDGPEDLTRSQWQEGYAAQEALEQEDALEDDFASPQDAPYVEKDLKSIRAALTIKLVLTAILAIISLYLALSLDVFPFAEELGLNKLTGGEGEFMLPLLAVMAPEENMRLFLIVNLAVCILAAITCSNVVGGGLLAFCRLHADSDSPAALAVLGAVVQGIIMIIFPDEVQDTVGISFYFPVAVFALLFNLIGKQLLMKRVYRNFRFVTSEERKLGFVQIRNRDFAREFSRGLAPDVDQVAYSVPADFFSGFLDRSYSPDYSNSFSRIVVPITFAGAVLVGGVSAAVFSETALTSVSAAAAVLCVCAPFSSAVIPNLMLGKVARKLTKAGAMLPGYDSAEELAGTNALVVNDKDLFSPENVMLHGMKVFAEKRIDEAILDAASVILSCDGIMSAVFLNMVGGNRRLLRKVDSLIYEDGMGISAWVDGKRVLIGSRELMQHHEVDCPSRDFEGRYTRDGRQVLYISNSGELSAMFVVSYNGDPDTADLLEELERRGISLIVYATDPNVTSELIAMVFGMKRTHVRILPAKLHSEYKFLTRPKERISASGAHAGGIAGAFQLIKAAGAVRSSVIHATIVQLIGVIVGYGLVALMAFTGSLESASFGTLILFNLAWLAVSSIAAAMVKF